MKSWIVVRVAIVAITMAMVASAALAEPPIGSRLGDRDEKRPVGDEQAAVHAAHQFAGCLVVKRGSSARGLLDTRDQKQAEKFGSQLGGEVDCITNITRNDLVEGVAVNYPYAIMRGDIAEDLIKRNESSVRQLQPLSIERTYSRPWFALTTRNPSVDEMGACVANTDPAAILALIDTEASSSAEDAAFGALIPALGPCLVAGTKLDAKREPLRAALAEALYQRWAHPEENASPAVQLGVTPPPADTKRPQ